jgi:hypothetical protein
MPKGGKEMTKKIPNRQFMENCLRATDELLAEIWFESNQPKVSRKALAARQELITAYGMLVNLYPAKDTDTEKEV